MELTQQVRQAFQEFRCVCSDVLGSKTNEERETKIREQICNLQKRTAETLEVVTNCKEDVSSVVFLDTKPDQSFDVDESMISETRSLSKLAEEMKTIQKNSSVPSSSVATVERPDIENMKNATDQLLDDLERISKNYAGEKKTWLSKFPRKRQL